MDWWINSHLFAYKECIFCDNNMQAVNVDFNKASMIFSTYEMYKVLNYPCLKVSCSWFMAFRQSWSRVCKSCLWLCHELSITTPELYLLFILVLLKITLATSIFFTSILFMKTIEICTSIFVGPCYFFSHFFYNLATCYTLHTSFQSLKLSWGKPPRVPSWKLLD